MAKRTTSDGKEYEKLAESIFKKLNSNNKSTKIERNISLDSEYGKREFDVVVTTIAPEFEVSAVVESKDYGKPVSIAIIEAFISKLDDFNVKQRFIISRSGFTKPSLAKAKNNGIVCCTAQEALHPKWNIDSYIPIYVTEVIPVSVHIQYNNLFIRPKESFFPLMINKIETRKIFKEKWERGDFVANKETNPQIIEFPEITPPYLVDFTSPSGVTESREIQNLKYFVTWKWSYYKSSLDQIKKSQLLKYCQADSMHLFLDYKELEKYESFMDKIEKEDIDLSKALVLLVDVMPSIEFDLLSMKNFNFDESTRPA